MSLFLWNAFQALRGCAVRAMLASLCAAVCVASDLCAETKERDNERSPSVLLLFDERLDLPGMASINHGFESEMRTLRGDSVTFYREQLDLSRFGSAEHLDRLSRYLAEKYANKNIDVVVPVMSPAVIFAKERLSAVFPGVPHVFCGVGIEEIAGLVLDERFTGVLFDRRFGPTIDIAVANHPGVERFAVIAGSSEFDQRLLEMARVDFASYEERFAFDYLDGLSYAALTERLGNLPDDTIALYLTLFRDSEGEAFAPATVLSALSQTSSVPIYGFVDQFLGSGIVGGDLYSIEHQGREAASLVHRVFEGERPNSVKPVFVDEGIVGFDTVELSRWGIPSARLPEGSRLINVTPTFWGTYKWHVLAGILLVLVQATLILAMWAKWRKAVRVEAKLRLSQARFESVCDAAPALIFIADPKANGLYFNKLWRGKVGIEAVRDNTANWLEFVHPEDRVKLLSDWDEVFELGEQKSSQFRLNCKDAGYREMLAQLSPQRGYDGKCSGIIGVCLDVTDERRYQTELQQSQLELVHMSKVSSLGMLSSALIHELNQPLGSILTNAQAAVRFLEQTPPDLGEVGEILEDIVSEDQRATDIIARLRRLFRSEGAPMGSVDLNGLIDDVLSVIRPELARHCPDIELRLGVSLPLCVGDAVPLQQVIMNLLNNSCDAMRSVPLRLRRVIVRTAYRPDLRELRLSVVDCGHGMDEVALRRLFTPMFSTKPGGLGVGLSICKSILDAHGGRIWAHNNEGGGASFHVALPVAGTEKAPSVKAVTHRRMQSKKMAARH